MDSTLENAFLCMSRLDMYGKGIKHSQFTYSECMYTEYELGCVARTVQLKIWRWMLCFPPSAFKATTEMYIQD